MTDRSQDVRDEFRDAQQVGGQPIGGGAEAPDQDAAGGSSGEGGYGRAMDQKHDGGETDLPAHPAHRELSRGERFDLEQGGGRSSDGVDFGEELKEDQHEHQDQGQRFIDEEGAVTEGQQP